MSALQLISHRLLVSALPHELGEGSKAAEPDSGASLETPVIQAHCQVLPERDLSQILDRDDAAFRTCRPLDTPPSA